MQSPAESQYKVFTPKTEKPVPPTLTTVAQPPKPGKPALPFTGTDLLLPLILGLVVIACGVILRLRAKH